MTYNELKYLENEKRRLNAFTRNIARAIEEATLQARREETMKHFEHCAFIDAWENGLREFLNHDGGPYLQQIELKDKFVLLNAGDPDQELVQVIGIEVSYFVESFSHEVILHGAQVVDAILKDFNTNEVEYVKKA